jgi:hypothetical protein
VSDAPLLFANLGAEEGEGWRRLAAHPRVRTAARLWAALFPAESVRVDGLGARAELPGALAHDAQRAALEPCESRGLVPWLSTPEAEDQARRARVPLAAAPPRVAARVHDKAFALEVARGAGLLPAELSDTAFSLAPEELGAPDTVRCRIEAELERWPAELREEFVLKPRLGTSGRGRLTGRDGRIDPESLRGNLPRFRERGGCVVEPWLERSADLSAQLWIEGPGEVRLLGTLGQVLTPAGVPLGHLGVVSPDGAIASGSPWDAELRAAAAVLAEAAAAAGYTGPCGLDAFAYRGSDGRERFRPVVEWNARFTGGTSALGLLARARRAGWLDGVAAFALGVAPPDPPARRLELFADDPELGLWLTPRGR